MKLVLTISLNLLACYAIVKAHEGVKYTSDTFHEALAKKSQFVMFFAPWCGHCKRLAPTWEQLAEIYNSNDGKDVTVAKVDCTLETALCEEQGISGYPTLKFFKLNDKDGTKYYGNRNLDDLEKFITEQSDEAKPDLPKLEMPTGVVELTEENFKPFVQDGDHFVKFYAPWCGHCQKMAGTWESLAESLKFDPSVKISKIDCTTQREICREYEVKGYPTLLWLRNGKKEERYQGSRSHEDLKEFVIKMKEHNVEQDNEVDTGKIAENDESSVVPLTADNFKNGVASGITFVKFFAPWCGHCKRLAPLWEELGLKFVSNSNVKVATVDCTTDTNKDLCKDYNVDGYPTLILFKNGKKQNEYTGSRDFAALHSFVMSYINRDEL